MVWGAERSMPIVCVASRRASEAAVGQTHGPGAEVGQQLSTSLFQKAGAGLVPLQSLQLSSSQLFAANGGHHHLSAGMRQGTSGLATKPLVSGLPE